MLKGNNEKNHLELMLIREKNLEKWNDEDFLFYEDFFGDLQIAKEDYENREINHRCLSGNSSGEAWLKFKTILNEYEQE